MAAKPAKSAPKGKPAPAKSPVPAKAPAKPAPAKTQVKAPAVKADVKDQKNGAKVAPAQKQTAPAKPAATTKPSANTKPVATGKPAANAKPAGKATAKSAAPANAKAPAPGESKSGRKGITIVAPKPVKKAKPKPRAPMSGAHAVPSMLGGRGASVKPLIPSGPAASSTPPLGYHGQHQDGPRPDHKTPFSKKELSHFRQILIQKRIELVRDVSSMESEALKGESGSLSSLPQHLAEQGSETYDQSLSLDLAAADRKLIKEIDDALGRIDAGTYGICELTGKPIKVERLEELPWARYSIEAARDLERRHMRL